MIAAPCWATEELLRDISLSTGNFRRERMQEPLEAYIEAFEQYRRSIEELLSASADLTKSRRRRR